MLARGTPRLLGVLWPIAIVGALSAVGSIALGIAVWKAAIGLLVLFIGGWFATEPEYMPGQVDNPDGKELHPGWLLLMLIAAIAALLVLGYVFPAAREFRL
jgi:hypothetical protein